MFLSKTIELYRENARTALAFGILMVFVVLFAQFQNVFLGSGTIFLDYNFIREDLGAIALQIAAIAVFLALYSVFVSLIVLGTRKELSGLRVEHYLREEVPLIAGKIFVFYFIFVIGLALIAGMLVNIGMPVITMNVLLLIVAVLFLFTPQSIAVDEKGILESMYYNLEFIFANLKLFVYVLIVSTAILLVIPLIELLFDPYYFLGGYIGIALLLLFGVPFIETLKTQFYMLKFGLVRGRHDFDSRKRLI